MENLFKEWTDQFLKIIVDDVSVHNNDWSEHLEHLRLVFERLRFVNLKLNPKKCCFGAQEIVFLGHVVNEQGSKPYLAKGVSIPTPSSITNVWAFLGFTGYYKTFIQGYATIVGSLFDLI
jgi:hypothetical protein